MTDPTSADVKEARVVFTTKELLSGIHDRLTSLEQLAREGVSRAEFEKLDQRVEDLEQSRLVQQTLDSSKTRAWTVREKIILGVFALITTVLNVTAASKNIHL